LAHWALFPEPLPASRIRTGLITGKASWLDDECGFKSYGDFQRCVAEVPRKGGHWRECFVTPGASAPHWAPLEISFWRRDSLEVLKDLLGDVQLAESMCWAPQKHFNRARNRLYSELWSGDWWWTIQVYSNQRCLTILGSSQSSPPD
jgi:Plavaka transposase